MSDALFKALAAGGRELPLPCEIDLAGEVLHAERSLRLLPGKRVTLLGRWRGEAVVAKLFLPHAARELTAETGGFAALRGADIAAPNLLWSGALAGACACAVYRYLEGAVSLSEGLRTERRPELLERSLSLLARMHRAGLWQADIHLDNFIEAGERLYVVDNGSIRIESAPLSAHRARDNLAAFVAQFTWCERDEVLAALDSYAPAVKRKIVAQRAETLWWRRTTSYLKKVFRDCTEIAVRRSQRYFLAHKRRLPREWVERFVADPDGLMAAGQLLKDGNSATVVRVDIDGAPVVIKRYNLKHPLHALRRCLRKTRAWNAWRAAHLLSEAGIATPAPLLLLERRLGPLRWTSYLVTADVGGEEMLEVYRRRVPAEDEVAQVARVFRAMRELRLCHGDFKAKNFLIADTGLQLLDLDVLREQCSARRFRRCAEKDRQRFLRNWEDRPELREKFAVAIEEAIAAS